MSFLTDLQRGKEGEKIIWGILEKCGFRPQPFNNSPEFDIECKKPPFKIEIKNDLYAIKSGNLAIETRNTKKDKPSGIYITSAELWVHLAFDRIFISSVKKIKNFLNTVSPLRIIKDGGDNNAELFLYKFNIIRDIFKEVSCKNDKDSIEYTKLTILGILNEII